MSCVELVQIQSIKKWEWTVKSPFDIPNIQLNTLFSWKKPINIFFGYFPHTFYVNIINCAYEYMHTPSFFTQLYNSILVILLYGLPFLLAICLVNNFISLCKKLLK